MKLSRKVYTILIALLYVCTVARAQAPFEGGVGSGFADARSGGSLCTPGAISPFSGGSETGNFFASRMISVCAPTSFSPFSGGTDEGRSNASYIKSVCAKVEFTAFSGGESDGDAYGNLINSLCLPKGDVMSIFAFPSAVCAGTPITIQGIGFTGVTAVSFHGTNATGFVVTSDTTIDVVVPVNATTGAIKLTGPDGTATSISSIAIAAGAPAITAHPVNKSECEGQELTLAAAVTSWAGAIYQWRKDGNEISGADDSALVLNNVALADSGYYDVILSNGCGADTSNTARLDVKPVATVQALATDTVMCPGDSMQVCANNTLASYLWSTGATTACTYVLNAGNYQLSATASNGCPAVSNRVAITVYSPSAVSITINGDTLSTQPALAYQWLLNGNPIPNATQQTYIIRQGGIYSVEVTDANGCKAISPEVNTNITGMGKLAHGSYFEVYPNPATDNAVQLKAAKHLVGANVLVLDMNGREVMNVRMTNENISLNISLLQAGVYYLRCQGEVKILLRQ